MNVCPRCGSERNMFVSAHMQFYDDGAIENAEQYLCLNCSEVWTEYKTLDDGTDDDTRPSHDDVD